MKRHAVLTIGAAVALAFTSATAFAQAQSRFQGVAVSAGFVQSPQYEVKTISQLLSNDRWLEVKVDYTTALVPMKDGKGTDWLDDVSFEYEILLPTDDKGANYVLLTGKVDYWSIPMDGKKHQADAYIHPRFIQRYAPDLKMRSSSLKNLYAKVTITANRAIVGGAFYAPRGKSNADADAMFRRAATMTTLTRVIDSVYGRDKTPWLFVNPDLYQLIKPGGK
jgi:hypothetical protein